MQDLAQQLIAKEREAGGSADSNGRPAFRVCEKLRGPLSAFAGIAGYRSLLLRALALAKTEAPLLERVRVEANGTLLYSAEPEAQLATPEVAQAEVVLTNQLLGLLVTFIGETLTLRLVQDVWPDATIKKSHLRNKEP